MARYIPILRWKRGERTALQALSPQGRANIVPVLVIAPEQYSETAETRTKAAMTAAESLVQEVLTAWGTQPFFLDASSLGTTAASGNPAIRAIANRARAAGCHLIPATPLGASTGYLNEVARIAARDGHGIGLRVDLQEFTTANGWAPTWPRPLNETDLIADFADGIGHVAALGTILARAFNGLHRATDWRSVTIAGTSMPPTFTGYPQGAQTITRVEWGLWHSLAPSISAYDLDFGDYATINPNAPPPPPGGVGFPINAKYTLEREFLICRGVRPSGPAGRPQAAQFVGHAQTIRGYSGQQPFAHCWADSTIDRIAAQTENPGNPEKWVKIAINRHIEITRDRLP